MKPDKDTKVEALEQRVGQLEDLVVRLAQRARKGVMTHAEMDEVHTLCDEADRLGVDGIWR